MSEVTRKIDHKKTGITAMILASLCFASGGLFIKLIPWNPLAINGARNLIASAVIGIYIIIKGHRLTFNFTVFSGAVCMAGVTTLFSVANKMTTAGNAIILQYTAPIWIVILMFVFFGKKPDKREIIVIGVVFLGIICFFFDSLSRGGLAGDLIALAAGLFYGGMFILNQFEKGDALSSMFFGQLFTGICLTPMVLRESDFSFQVLLLVFLLGSIQVGLAYILFSIGTKYTDPVTASIINAFEPILNPVLVAVFYGEKLGKLSLIGACIVIGGILYYNLRQKNENSSKK